MERDQNMLRFAVRWIYRARQQIYTHRNWISTKSDRARQRVKESLAQRRCAMRSQRNIPNIRNLASLSFFFLHLFCSLLLCFTPQVLFAFRTLKNTWPLLQWIKHTECCEYRITIELDWGGHSIAAFAYDFLWLQLCILLYRKCNKIFAFNASQFKRKRKKQVNKCITQWKLGFWVFGVDVEFFACCFHLKCCL